MKDRPVPTDPEKMGHVLNREVIPKLREIMRALSRAPGEFSWSGGNATIDVSQGGIFTSTLTMSENCSLVLSNGSDGVSGMFFVQQDSTGSHELTVTADGRTIIRPDPDTDDFPDPSPDAITSYEYLFVTVEGSQYLMLRKQFML